MRVAIDTHGCRLNQAESDAIAAALAAQGHELVGSLEQADCYVLNTCTITHEADADARAAIADGTVSGGMIPKLEEAMAVVDQGVGAIHILGKLAPGDLVRAVCEPGSVGTTLVA